MLFAGLYESDSKPRKAYIDHCRKSIQDEFKHLHNRIVVLTILDTLFLTNPPFYDDEKDEIVEPWKAIFTIYADVFDDKDFITLLKDIQQKKYTPVKLGSAKRMAK